MQWAYLGKDTNWVNFLNWWLEGGERELKQAGWSLAPSGECFRNKQSSNRLAGFISRPPETQWTRLLSPWVGSYEPQCGSCEHGAKQARHWGGKQQNLAFFDKDFFRATLARTLRTKMNFCKFLVAVPPNPSPQFWNIHSMGGDFCLFASLLNLKHLEHFLAHCTRIIKIA